MMLGMVYNMNTNTMFKQFLESEIQGHTNLEFEYSTEGIPSTGVAIHRMWWSASRGVGTFRVFNGSNEAHNLYFSPDVNLLYRTVHDLDHAVAYEVGRGTTKYADELYLNCWLAKRAYLYAIKHHSSLDALRLFFEVYHDTVGQVHFYKVNGVFLVNQKANTTKLLNHCAGYSFVKHGQVRLAYQVMIAYLIECGL